jgi:hypothetical protein
VKQFLYNGPLLPEGFRLPTEYQRLVSENALPDAEPWFFLSQDMGATLSYYGAMLQKFPGAFLVPFAMVNDQSGHYNDGWVVLACFDGCDKSENPRVCIYDYSRPTSAPWDSTYANFATWLAMAKKESARYKVERADNE